MRRFAVLALCVVSLSVIGFGCKKQADPKSNPNFNEAALKNPSAVKMGAEAPVPTDLQQPQN